MTSMKKSELVPILVQEKKYKEALRICKCWKLPITPEESNTLRRGYECMVHRRSYESLGIDPDVEILKAIHILENLYTKPKG